jgi:hypothetical protein
MAYVLAMEQFAFAFRTGFTMQPLWVNTAAFTVVTIFFIWRAFVQVRAARGLADPRKTLRERVAYMLWVAADECEEPATHGSRG